MGDGGETDELQIGESGFEDEVGGDVKLDRVLPAGSGTLQGHFFT